ncbi:ABC transporter permease [Cellulomonas hominis]|jgi:peptide/nickel transport system permease protein|uniref:ABC transporter permease n=1 Tax=Cellulomonas hominis TaxID=156981 RepID=A0A511FFA3_9CELL|nr:ABC transporter permease [Cellulomonas hominis]MBB5471270.1 peptide/nickel transport system permease protein [Cellulomonas hominis]NKY06504.1 ABC transporter permease [Cellulomonas hominis]GEL47939.1 ABC transporter permease [Cellulomonas hominis]
MWRFALRRVLFGAALFVIVSFTTMLLLSFSFDSIVGSRLGSAATAEAIATMKADLGLDRSIVVQYVDWLGNVLRGDFGHAFFTGQSVGEAIPARLGVTMSVVLPALAISAVIAVVLGTLAATRGGWVDKAAQGMMLTGYLIPNLLIAILLVVVFAVNLGWVPAGGFTPFSTDPSAWARSVVLPVAAMAFGGAANIANQVRGTMIDELRKDYVRTLRTRGVPTRSIVIRHALRNAAGPALTVLGLTFINLFGAALFIEQVFALPGFGVYSFNVAMQGDFPVLMGLTAFSVALTIGVNLLIDVANGWLNPKARMF